MPLNVKLKMAILKSGRNQSEIARRARLHTSVLSGVVHGRIILTPAEKSRLARQLKAGIAQLGLS